MTPRKPRRLRALLVVAAASVLLPACVAVLVYVQRAQIAAWARARLEQELARVTGGHVRIGALEAQPFGLEGRLGDLEIVVPGEEEGESLVLSLGSGRLQLAWAGLLALPAGRVHLRALTLESPVVSLDRSFLDARGRTGLAGGLDLRVDRLTIQDGTLHYRDRTVPFSIDGRDVSVLGEWDRLRRMLVGEASFTGSWSQPLLRGPLPVTVASGFRVGAARIDLLGLRIEGPGIRLDLDGHATFGEDASFAAEGPVVADLAVLSAYFAEDFPSCAGHLSGQVRIDRAGLPLHVVGRIHASEARLGSLTAEHAEADADYRPGVLRLTDLEASAYGGVVSGEVDVLLDARRRFRAEVTGKGLDVESLLDLAGTKLPFASRANLVLRLEGDPGSRGTWNGSGRITTTAPEAVPPGKVPASGSAEFALRDGRLEAHGTHVATASALVDASLELDLASKPPTGELVLDGTTGSAAGTREEVKTVLDSLGLGWPAALEEALGGSGAIRARVGIGRGGDLDLLLDLENGSLALDPFRRAQIDLALRRDHLDLRRLAVTAGEGEARVSGRFGLAPFAVERLDVSTTSFPVEPLIRRGVPGLPLTGTVTAEIGVEGHGEERVGSGRLLLEKGLLSGEPYDRSEATFELHGSRVVLRVAALTGPAGEARGEIRADLDGSALELEIERAHLTLGAIDLLRARQVGLSGDAILSGTIDRRPGALSGTLRLEGTGWSIRGFPVGDVLGTLGIEPSEVEVDLGPREGKTWRATGTIGLADTMPVHAALVMDDAVYALPVGADPRSSWALVSGNAEIDGTLSDPSACEGTGEISRAEIHLGPVTATTVRPIALRLASGVLAASPIHLEGSNSDVEASLRYRFGGAIDGACVGRLDLGSIAALWPGLRASGEAAVDLALQGTLDEPDWRGSFVVRGGRIRSSMFAETLEEIDLKVRFDRREAELQDFSAVLGGGEVSASGRAELRGLTLSHYSVGVAVANVRIAYPEGFRGAYEGQISLDGTLDTATVAGRLELLRGVYSKEFAPFVGTRVPEEPVGTSLGSTTLLLDLDVEAERNVWVQNEVARIESAVDLHVGGDLARPEVTGRIWALEGGTVRLRDVEYRVLSASLDFVDLERINPYIDVKAETRVREYDIALSVEGTAEKFRYELTSNPALSTQDIIALLTTGSTLQESGSTGLTAGGGATQDMAADYVVGALTGGLERKLRTALGLERVRIDPLLTPDQGDPTARITVGKRVGKDLVLVYSTDVGSTEQQIYRAEWEATRKLRLRAERNSTGGVAGELGYFTRVGGGSAVSSTEAAGTARATAPARASAERVAEIRIDGVPETEAAELAKKVALTVGSEARRSSVFAGEEAIRAHYVSAGNLEARVDSEIVPVQGSEGSVRVYYHVRPGPPVEVSVVGISGKDLHRIERSLAAFWNESIFSEDLYVEAANMVREDLRARGYFTAEVKAEVSGDAARRTVRLVAEPGDLVRVESVRIEGASEVGEDAIRRRLETRASSVSTRVVRADALERDRRAIASLYQSEGFLRATVDRPRVLLSVRGNAADVVFKVEEGPRTTIAAVKTEEHGAVISAQIVEWSGLRVGESFSYSRLVDAESAVRTHLDALGYPEARVRSRYSLEADRVEVRLDVETGERKTVGAISIVGNRLTREKVVRRELLLAPGEPLSRERMVESQQRLYRLGLFRSVRIEYSPIEGGAPDSQLLRVRLDEVSPVLLGLSGGYDTEVGPRATFSVTHVNVGGFNRSLSLQGAASPIYQWLQLIAREPRLFNWPLPAIFSVGRSHQEQIGFTEDRRSAAARVEKRLRSDLTSFVRYNYQHVDLVDIEDELAVEEQKLENVKLGDLGYTVAFDRRDDPFMTQNGHYAAAEVRVFAPPFLSESSFTKIFLQGSTTHTAKNRNTLAGAVRFGAAVPFGSTDRVPLPERFFAGGDSTLRGFPRDEAGPKTSDGTPEGGQALLLINQEWRFPIWRSLKGELFVDVGNVWSELSELSLSDLRTVAGAGLRFETPIGPIRLEYGHKLDRKPDESRGEIFVSIGSAF